MAERDEVHAMGEMYRLGMDCLVRRFGIVNTELFLAAVKTGISDYTKWRRQAFGGMAPGESDAEVARFADSRGKSRRFRPARNPTFTKAVTSPSPQMRPSCSHLRRTAECRNPR